MRALLAACLGTLRLVVAASEGMDWAAVSLAMEVGDYNAAETRLRQAPGPDARLSAALGLIHSKRREYVQAEAAFREALRLEPGNGLHAWNLGEFLYMTGQWPAAVEAYDQVPAGLPQHPFAQYKAILAFLRHGDRPAAWERIAPLRLSEEHPLYLFAHAAWHASDGRLDQGLWFARSAASFYRAEGVRLYVQPLRDAAWLPPE